MVIKKNNKDNNLSKYLKNGKKKYPNSVNYKYNIEPTSLNKRQSIRIEYMIFICTLSYIPLFTNIDFTPRAVRALTTYYRPSCSVTGAAIRSLSAETQSIRSSYLPVACRACRIRPSCALDNDRPRSIIAKRLNSAK